MINFLLGRIGSAFITVFGASVLAFVVLRAVPTNPARLIAGPFANDEVIASITAQLGLDKPLFVQYFDYFTLLGRLGIFLQCRPAGPVPDS